LVGAGRRHPRCSRASCCPVRKSPCGHRYRPRPHHPLRSRDHRDRGRVLRRARPPRSGHRPLARARAVTVESTEDKVEISASRSRFGLRSYPVVEFPRCSHRASPAPPWPHQCSPRACASRPCRVDRRRPSPAHRCAHDQRGRHRPPGRNRLLPPCPADWRGPRASTTRRRSWSRPGARRAAANPLPGNRRRRGAERRRAHRTPRDHLHHRVGQDQHQLLDGSYPTTAN